MQELQEDTERLRLVHYDAQTNGLIYAACWQLVPDRPTQGKKSHASTSTSRITAALVVNLNGDVIPLQTEN